MDDEQPLTSPDRLTARVGTSGEELAPDGRPGGGSEAGRCGCCGQPLPVSTGRARPRRWCPTGAGRYVAEYGIECAELGPAVEKVRQVFGTTAVPAADLTVLGEHVDAVRAVFADTGPVAALTRVLGGLAGQLDDTVASAITRAETAEADARDAAGRTAVAERLRATAEQQAVDAHHQAAAARRDADRAAAAAAAAEQRARAAEQDAFAARDVERLQAHRADRADQAAGRDRERAENALAETAAAAATLAAVREQLTATEEAAAVDRRRADTLQTTLDELRAAHAGELLTARTEHAAVVQQLSRDHASELRRLQQDHATVLAERDRTLDLLRQDTGHRLRSLRNTLTRLAAAPVRTSADGLAVEEAAGTENAAPALDRVRATLTDLIADHLDDLTPPPQQP